MLIGTNKSDFVTPTQVFWEMHKITAVVPKHQEKTTLFRFLAILPMSVWTLLYASALLCTTLNLLTTRKGERSYERGQKLFADYLFWYYGQTLCQYAGKNKNLFVLLWSFCVSIVIAELLRSGLFTQMTLREKSWPATFSEIYDQKDRYSFISTNWLDFNDTCNPKMAELQELATLGNIENPTTVLKKMRNGDTILLAKSAEVVTVLGLFNPDKFAYLDDMHLLSQEVFLVRKNFKHRSTVLKV